LVSISNADKKGVIEKMSAQVGIKTSSPVETGGLN
jgi:hypothetical protein